MTTVLVIHAKHLTDRKKHMERQLQSWPGQVEYILDYDKSELTDEVIRTYEDSSLQFIPRSRRVSGKRLYEAPHGRVRFNGCLYINQKAAQAIVNDVKTHQCDIAVDHYYVHLYGKGLVQFLWSEPCLATQGSFNGAFVSSIGGQVRTLEYYRWKLKYAYKRLVYWFR